MNTPAVYEAGGPIRPMSDPETAHPPAAAELPDDVRQLLAELATYRWTAQESNRRGYHRRGYRPVRVVGGERAAQITHALRAAELLEKYGARRHG